MSGDKAGTANPSEEERASLAETVKLYLPLWPFVLGLALGRTGVIVASFGSYTRTDDGIFTDGSMLVAVGACAIIVVLLAIRDIHLPKRRIRLLMHLSIAGESAMLSLLAITSVLGVADDRLHFALCTIATFVGLATLSFWLRRARGSTTATAAVFVFSALFISEITIYLCSLAPTHLAYVLGLAFTLAQLPCMKAARLRSKLFAELRPAADIRDYFGFAKSMLANRWFLAATACGIGLMAVVIGLLRGYPSGNPIGFAPLTRVAYMLLTMSIAATVVWAAIRGRKHIMTVGVWVIMQALTVLALLAYTVFPDALDIGAVFTTALNATMTAFSWYIAIAFMSHGWREPYYYVFSGWTVWLGCRALARIVLIGIYSATTSDPLSASIIGAILIVSMQVVFVQFIFIAGWESPQRCAQQNDGQEPLPETPAKQSALEKIMGLDKNESLSGMRQAAMQHSAEEMGAQFLLSEREMEVLALYALGFTQKRVAEELFISQGTAHAHIKRIYAKTGLHSRQEILDYMQHYTS